MDIVKRHRKRKSAAQEYRARGRYARVGEWLSGADERSTPCRRQGYTRSKSPSRADVVAEDMEDGVFVQWLDSRRLILSLDRPEGPASFVS